MVTQNEQLYSAGLHWTTNGIKTPPQSICEKYVNMRISCNYLRKIRHFMLLSCDIYTRKQNISAADAI